MIFNDHRYDFLPMNYKVVGECSSTNMATFVGIDVSGRGKASSSGKCP